VVQAYKNMVEWCPAGPSEPAFSFVQQSGEIAPLTHRLLVVTVKKMAKWIGLQETEVAGHSFRRGGATYAFMCGVPTMLIQRQGGWRSEVYKDYVWTSPAACLSCSALMLKGVQVGNTAAGVQLDTTEWGG
jgi:integrase